MRQGNGTDLLGANDPRAASIGIIYVAPSDDRTSVLAAILTQEKLGRKQVAVVLPTPNKAFQRSVDFDDLKAVRRKLQVDVIFIAPPGPGPAEFARQRRFPVYSSLENYAQALREQDDALIEPVGNERKGFKLFGRGKANAPAAPIVGEPSGDEDLYEVDPEEEEEQRPPVYPMSASRHAEPEDEPYLEEEEDQHQHGGAGGLAAGAAGAAAGFALGDLVAQQGRQPAPQGVGGSTQAINLDHEDDDAFLPPTPEPAGPPASAIPIRSGTSVSSGPPPAQNPPLDEDEEFEEDAHGAGLAGAAAGAAAGTAAESAEPGIIEFSPRRGPRGTQPLPNNAPFKNRSGNAAAAGAGLGFAAGSIMRTPPPPTAPPPARAVPSGRNPRRSSRARWLIIPILILVTALLVCTSLALANPAMVKQIASSTNIPLPGGPTVTVGITPASQIVSDSYIITGVTGTPDPKQQTIKARNLSSNAQSQGLNVKATGHQLTKGQAATGILTFFGIAPQGLTIGRTTFHANGMAFTTNASVFVPAFDGVNVSRVTVAATADSVGAAGNIGAQSINQTCCVNGISVRNLSAFTGGVDPADYSFVTNDDVNGAITQQVLDQVTKGASDKLNGQLAKGEVLADNPQCKRALDYTNPIGDQGHDVPSTTVTVSETCKDVAYDDQGMRALVTQLLTQKAQVSPGTGYTLQDNRIIINPKVQTTNPVSLNVTAKGQWVYQISDQQKTQLLNLIKGKTVDDAKAALLGVHGIAGVTIQYSGSGPLPTDIGQMAFNITPPPSLQEGSGAGGAAGATPTVTISTTPLSGPGTPEATGVGRG